MPFNFDPNHPGDSDIVSQFPANERASRAAMLAAFDVEHSTNTGHHHLPTFVSAAERDAYVPSWEDGAFAATLIGGSTAFQLQRYTTAGWQPFQDIPPGAIMLFVASTAPVGWTQVSDWNDRLIRIISGGTADVGGSWNITGLNTENNLHFHSFSGGTSGPSSSATAQGAAALGLATNVHTHTFSGNTSTENAGHSHTSDGSWRPAYLDVISCQKNAVA